jgi:hypothetical protein
MVFMIKRPAPIDLSASQICQTYTTKAVVKTTAFVVYCKITFSERASAFFQFFH